MKVSAPVAPRLVSIGRERKINGQCVTSRQVPCKMNNKRVTHSIGCNPRLHAFRSFVDGIEYWKCKWPRDPDVGNLLQLHSAYDRNMQTGRLAHNSLPGIRPSFPEKHWYSHNTKILLLMVWKQCCKNYPIQRQRTFRTMGFLNFVQRPVVLQSATCSVWNTLRRSKPTSQAILSAIGLYLPQSPV
jgi:hypothetical protein